MQKKITEVAKILSISENDYSLFNKDIIKINPINNPVNKLIITTSINPTIYGEGKTTLSIGLNDAFNYNKEKSIAVLREPSLGPVFGLKGTATGNGKTSMFPSNKINLNFTGDFYALTSCNNLISTIIENEIYFDNKLNIDHEKIIWKRCIDLNDRGLRNIEVKIKDKISYKTGFNITAASDIMALFCLVNNKEELKEKLDSTIVAYSFDNKEIKIKDLEITDAILNLLEDALKPNLVQSLISSPIIVHGGPFANIAHGCNSLIATKTSMSLAEYSFTEAGFGADLGFEKFMNIKCRIGNIYPNAVVLCITIKALKHHGEFNNKKTNPLENCFDFLNIHINHIRSYNFEPIILLNRFANDSDEDIALIKNILEEKKLIFEIVDFYNNGFEDSKKIVELVKNNIIEKPKVNFTYNLEDTLELKIKKVAKNAYGIENIEFANNSINDIKKFDYKNALICISKTPMSLSSDPTLLNYEENRKIIVTGFNYNSSLNMVIVNCGNTIKLPGLPRNPLAKNFKI